MTPSLATPHNIGTRWCGALMGRVNLVSLIGGVRLQLVRKDTRTAISMGGSLRSARSCATKPNLSANPSGYKPKAVAAREVGPVWNERKAK
jgi:hypothetical protein